MAYSLHFYNHSESYLCQILKSLLQRKIQFFSSNNSCLNKISVSLIFDLKGSMMKKRERETD